MSHYIYSFCEQDPFPIDAICGHVWRNDEGQLSFLRHAILSAPEVFSFVHSTRKLVRFNYFCSSYGEYIANYVETTSCVITILLVLSK